MQHIDPDLLERYFEGKCSEDQQRQVEQWLSQQDGFPQTDLPLPAKERLRLRQEIWQRVISVPGVPAPSRSESWQNGLFKWFPAAACVLIALSLFFHYAPLMQKGSKDKRIMFTAPYGRKSVVKLPDGSIAELNAGACLAYPETFRGNERKITLLRGEGFFDISTDPMRPFVVEVQAARIHVLGTRFNICQQAVDKDQLSVTLESGKIAFEAHGDQRLLKPGEQLIYHIPDRKVLIVGQADLKRVTAWRDGVLFFEDTPMAEVFNTLSSYYGVAFRIQNELKGDMLFTAQFRREPLGRVLELIEMSTGLHCLKKQNQIIVH